MPSGRNRHRWRPSTKAVTPPIQRRSLVIVGLIVLAACASPAAQTTYPEANGVYDDLFPALPRHLLEPAFRQGIPEAFINHPYWVAEYVGAGPFRLVRWEPGAFVEGAAFEGHALGRAKIDRLQIRFIAWNVHEWTMQ